jgi:hypothetical protein
MILTGKTEELVENAVPVPLNPPQIPHELTWAQTRTSAVSARWLTACAMAWPREGSVTKIQTLLLINCRFNQIKLVLYSVSSASICTNDIASCCKYERKFWTWPNCTVIPTYISDFPQFSLFNITKSSRLFPSPLNFRVSSSILSLSRLTQSEARIHRMAPTYQLSCVFDSISICPTPDWHTHILTTSSAICAQRYIIIISEFPKFSCKCIPLP